MSDGDRIVIYLDLLGFKERVKRESLDEVVATLRILLTTVYSAAIRYAARSGESLAYFVEGPRYHSDTIELRTVAEELKKQTWFSALLMSDSLVIYSDPLLTTSTEFLHRVAGAVLVGRIVMSKLFESALAARGAISVGEFHAEPQNSLFCGRALIEAYEVAESQQWIGMSICDSMTTHVQSCVDSYSLAADMKFLSPRRVPPVIRPGWDVIQYPVPFSKDTHSRWIVNWASDWNGGRPVRDDFFEDVMVDDERVNRKYINTLDYLKNWKNAWRVDSIVSGFGVTRLEKNFPRLHELKNKLLALHDAPLCYTGEFETGALTFLDVDELINNGQLISLPVVWQAEEGNPNVEPGGGHEMSSAGGSLIVMSGFALADDGRWHHHSWSVQETDGTKCIVETYRGDGSSSRRNFTKYFGIEYPGQQCAAKLESWLAENQTKSPSFQTGRVGDTSTGARTEDFT